MKPVPDSPPPTKFESRSLIARAAPPTAAFAVALFIRFALARHGISEIRTFFFTEYPSGFFSDKHSLVYPLVKYLVFISGADPVAGLFNLNAMLGALTVFPLYSFVRNRSGDGGAAFFAALVFAVHPVIARFSATDGHFSTLLFFWCSGLALLTSPVAGGAGIFFGTFSLGLAATTRIEGLVYLAASLPLLGLESMKRLARHPAAFIAALTLAAGLVVLQFKFKFEDWGEGVHGTFSNYRKFFNLDHDRGPFKTWIFLRLSMLDFKYTGLAISVLFISGAVVSALFRRWRWGLGLLAACPIVVLFTYREITELSPLFLHRTIPAGFLKCIGCGITLGWLMGLISKPGLKRAATMTAAAALTVGIPWAHAEFLGMEFAYDAEFKMLHPLEEVGKKAGLGNCHVVMMNNGPDIGLTMVYPALTTVAVHECTYFDEVCKDALSAGPCTYWFRNAHCYYSARSPAAGELPNEICEAVERSFVMEPVNEAVVNLRDTYGKKSNEYPREGVLGLYRVKGRS